jgi:hypothetical protein
MADLAKMMRLRSAARETLRQLGAITDANGMAESYERYRAEARLVVEDPTAEQEFDRLFPVKELPRYEVVRPSMAIPYGEAKACLAGLLGWLDGAVEAEQFDQQARANAEARLRDRGQTS